ncbi:MAG: hypothetical protein RR806_01395 [Oscillospiraceae bacterium]
MNKLLFKFEIKKLLSQTSTKVIAIILILFPIIIVFGIVSPSQQFSITMDNFASAADFSNAILGFLNSLGFYYIILVVLSASTLSKEIENKYLYFVLSAVPSCSRLFIYKALSVSLIFSFMVILSSLSGFITYSILYLGTFVVSVQIMGVLLWGIAMSFLITMIYMMLLTICNIITDGSIFASLTIAIITVVLLIVLGAVEGTMNYLPAWSLDYMPDRNNIFLVLMYFVILIISSISMYICTKKKRI